MIINKTINKVINNTDSESEALLDLTADTVAPENLLLNKTAHNRDGEGIVGEMNEGGTSDYDELQNRPSINSHILTGNKTGSQLGLQNRVLASTLNIGGQTIGNVEGALSALNESKSDLVNGKVPVNELPVYTPVIGSIQSIGGIVPPSSSGDEDKYLRSDGTWAKPAGGGGGVSNYDDLTNRPKVNGTTLSGDKTGTQLGLQNIVLSSTMTIGGQEITEVEPALHALNNKPSGGGHIILDEDGNTYPQRSKLQFEGAIVTDDETNDATVVETVNPVEYEEDIYGVNLIPYPYYSPNTRVTNGITFTVNADLSITANGTATADALFMCANRNPSYDFGIKLNIGTSYILTGCPSGGNSSTYFLRSNYAVNGVAEIAGTDVGNGAEFEAIEVDKPGYGVYITIVSGATVTNLTFRPMLRKATIQDDTYRPFNEQSIQNQLTDQTTVLGAKNLLQNTASSMTVNGVTFTVNADGSVTVSTGEGGATDVASFDINKTTFKISSKYKQIMTGCPKGGGVTTYELQAYRWTGNENLFYGVDYGDGVVLSNEDDNIARIKIIVRSGQVITTPVTFKPMIRLASDPDDTYVPYAMTNRELTEQMNLVTTLTSSNNLNDIKSTGRYYFNDAPTNSPESSSHCAMIVMARAENPNDIKQMIFKDTKIYTRSYNGTTWSSWYKFTGTALS